MDIFDLKLGSVVRDEGKPLRKDRWTWIYCCATLGDEWRRMAEKSKTPRKSDLLRLRSPRVQIRGCLNTLADVCGSVEKRAFQPRISNGLRRNDSIRRLCGRLLGHFAPTRGHDNCSTHIHSA